MSSIRESFKQLFTPVEPLQPGIYHYIAPPDDPLNYRLHLRLEPGGNGILIINAATVLHLNPTAAEYAYHLVQCTPEAEVVNVIASRYRVSRTHALQDYRDFVERIDTLVTTPDLDPITFLDFDRQEPYSGHISAPYRLDCALTYKLPEGVEPDITPTKRVTHELTVDEWITVVDKAWQLGIPHIIFTGGEPTLRDDLIQLIEKAEANGQVTGLLTDGLRLADTDYLDTLLQTGLDHLLIVLHPDIETTWTALQNALDEDIFTAVHITITPQNSSEVTNLVERLAEMNIGALSLSASADKLDTELEAARELAANLDVALVWDLPVPYSTHNPVTLEVEAESHDLLEGAGRAWLYVEPDGDVLPAQGINQVLGNVLTDPWDHIWSSEGN